MRCQVKFETPSDGIRFLCGEEGLRGDIGEDEVNPAVMEEGLLAGDAVIPGGKPPLYRGKSPFLIHDSAIHQNPGVIPNPQDPNPGERAGHELSR